MPNRNPLLFVPIEGGVAPGPFSLVSASPAPLVPHVLRLLEGVPKDVYLGLSPVGWVNEDDAFVFPSFRMAQRYAEFYIEHTHRVWMPVAAPERVPSVASDGAHCRGCGCINDFACPERCAWAEPDLCTSCARPDPLEMWAVYESPTDYPGKCVARRFCGQVPLSEVLVAETIEALRALRPAHLGIVPRHVADDPVIVETWM